MKHGLISTSKARMVDVPETTPYPALASLDLQYLKIHSQPSQT
jgi:hypothetical protein